MDKLIVSGKIRINPASRDKALALIEPLVRNTRTEEGCLSYGFYEDVTEPNSFRLYEEWKDQAAREAHMQTANMATFNEGVGTIEVLELEVKFYSADQIEQ